MMMTKHETALIIVALVLMALTVITHFAIGGFIFRRSGWRAWQPMRGSTRFVALQACAWTSAAVGVASLVACWALALDVTPPMREGWLEIINDAQRKRVVMAALSWIALGGSVASETLVAVSLAFFNVETTTMKVDATRIKTKSNAESILHVMHMLVVLQIIHAPHYVIFAVLFTGYAIGGVGLALATVVAYSTSFVFTPRYEQGKKSWLAFQTWTSAVIEHAAASWYGSVRVLCLDENDDETLLSSDDFKFEDDDGARTVFGYHPHGLIPTGSIWMSMTREFRERFKGLKPVTLAASALFRAPLVRELAAWMGVRSVSSSIFISALKRERAVIVVPGGQREMAEHIGGVNEEEIVFCTKHRGFIRIAIECNARLVPVVVFGESASYKNLWRSMGRFFYKNFRMAMPLFAVGYGGVLPWPSRVPLTFIIGAPIALPKPDARGVARATDIERAHVEYYARIERMFEKHKAASGFPNLKLTFKHDDD